MNIFHTMTKKKLLSLSVMFLLVMTTIHQIGVWQLCGATTYGFCTDVAYTFTMTLLPSIPLFLFSLLTYPLSEALFHKWWQFIRVSIPIMVLLIALSPRQSHDWMFPVEQGGVALFLCGLFSIGTIYIIYQEYKHIHE